MRMTCQSCVDEVKQSLSDISGTVSPLQQHAFIKCTAAVLFVMLGRVASFSGLAGGLDQNDIETLCL